MLRGGVHSNFEIINGWTCILIALFSRIGKTFNNIRPLKTGENIGVRARKFVIYKFSYFLYCLFVRLAPNAGGVCCPAVPGSCKEIIPENKDKLSGISI